MSLPYECFDLQPTHDLAVPDGLESSDNVTSNSDKVEAFVKEPGAFVCLDENISALGELGERIPDDITNMLEDIPSREIKSSTIFAKGHTHDCDSAVPEEALRMNDTFHNDTCVEIADMVFSPFATLRSITDDRLLSRCQSMTVEVNPLEENSSNDNEPRRDITNSKATETDAYAWQAAKLPMQSTWEVSSVENKRNGFREIVYECLESSLESSLPTVLPQQAALNRWHRCQNRRRKRAKLYQTIEPQEAAALTPSSQSFYDLEEMVETNEVTKSHHDASLDTRLQNSLSEKRISTTRSNLPSTSQEEPQKHLKLEQTIADLQRKVDRLTQINRMLHMEMGRARRDAKNSRLVAANLAAIGRIHASKSERQKLSNRDEKIIGPAVVKSDTSKHA